MASAFTTAVALRGEQTEGALSVVENTLPRPAGTARRCTTTRSTRRSTLLDGELTFQLGDELFTAGPGALAFAARRRRRTRSPTSATRLRATCCSARRPASRATSPASPPRPRARTAARGRWRRRRRSRQSAGRSAERGDVAVGDADRPRRRPASTSSCAASRTVGGVAVTGNRVPAGAIRGPPPAPTTTFDELFYVLEGELTFQLERPSSSRSARASSSSSPRGVAHAFANRGDAPRAR